MHKSSCKETLHAFTRMVVLSDPPHRPWRKRGVKIPRWCFFYINSFIIKLCLGMIQPANHAPPFFKKRKKTKHPIFVHSFFLPFFFFFNKQLMPSCHFWLACKNFTAFSRWISDSFSYTLSHTTHTRTHFGVLHYCQSRWLRWPQMNHLSSTALKLGETTWNQP